MCRHTQLLPWVLAIAEMLTGIQPKPATLNDKCSVRAPGSEMHLFGEFVDMDHDPEKETCKLCSDMPDEGRMRRCWSN